jgi:hypothetical protein
MTCSKLVDVIDRADKLDDAARVAEELFRITRHGGVVVLGRR